ncbi:hypothetical protein TetV_627 [Tetraselmis virus 1]|uniref:Uncharacterized protein n=1 Tax=Tetraselmis virus 1 TaxID=2060617 RepID=A0A2P0VPE0_9VIRU|nr:hypothetical protein QJ968_gp427 [Tetraselmis virus 1]AUF82709.1 hypothetical protein TetV_627 [Tetraselmis virus 1]
MKILFITLLFPFLVFATSRTLLDDSFFDIGDYDIDFSDDNTFTIVNTNDDETVVRHVQIVSGFDKVEQSKLDVNIDKDVEKINAVNFQVVVGAANTVDMLTTISAGNNIKTVDVENRQLVSGAINDVAATNDVKLGNVKNNYDATKNRYRAQVGL